MVLHIFTLLLPVITSIIITYYYKFIITYDYVIITSLLHHYLLPHYAILKIHVTMDSLLHIITLACFIITSLLPIMSLFPIITYY